MGEKVFGEIERVLVVPFFLAVMEYFPTFYATKPYLREWASKSGLKLHHILAQSFLCWYSSRCTRRNFTPRKFQDKNHHVGNGVIANHEAQINAVQNDFAQLDTSTLGNPMLEENGIVFSQLDSSGPLKEEIEAEVEPMEESLDATGNPEEANIADVAESQMPEVQPTPRILSIEPPLTDEQRWAILRCLIPIDFPVRNRFLKLAMQSLLFTKEHIPAVVDLVLQMAERGQASFSTLFYCMKEQDWMNHVKKPTIIIQAILRGPLTGDMVEFFLKNRDEKFRAEAKKLILHAEDMTRDPILFETSVREWAHTTVDQVPTFEQFCSNLNDLMRDLRK
uniref:Uncharacterized protein n=1 Tax=Acrobeloides nanus TaxID=290746 RepID=A0A914CLP1_9BILA